MEAQRAQSTLSRSADNSTDKVLKRTRLFKLIKRNGPLISMALPGILFIIAFAYVPMSGIIIAFKDYRFDKGIFGSSWIGLKNFEYLFASENAWHITFNTLYLNGLFIVTGTIISIVIALMMNEVKIKWLSGLFQSSFLIPYFLSWVVVSFFAYSLLNSQNGFINTMLEHLGNKPIDWFSEPKYWPSILVITNAWKSAGFSSVIYLAAMLGINQEYYEAAQIDGASKLQQITGITLPFIKPLIIMLTVLSIGRIFYADFGMFFNVTRDQGLLYPTTDVIDTYVFRMLRVSGDVGMASAAGFYQAVVGFILVLSTNYMVRKIDKENSLF